MPWQIDSVSQEDYKDREWDAHNQKRAYQMWFDLTLSPEGSSQKVFVNGALSRRYVGTAPDYRQMLKDAIVKASMMVGRYDLVYVETRNSGLLVWRNLKNRKRDAEGNIPRHARPKLPRKEKEISKEKEIPKMKIKANRVYTETGSNREHTDQSNGRKMAYRQFRNRTVMGKPWHYVDDPKGTKRAPDTV